MAANGKNRPVRDWFDGLSTPAKALLIVGPACLAAILVALIVVNGSPHPASTGIPAGVGGYPTTASPAASTAGTVATATVSPPGASGTSASAAAASAPGKAPTNKTTAASSTTGSGGANGTDPGTPQDGSDSAAPSKPPVLTAKLRKKIAIELVAAEKRAVAEAAAAYPVDPKKGGSLANSTQYEDLRSNLTDTYIAVIVKKYGLTTEQTIDILILDAATLK